jgi:hypothetical protein
MAQSFRLYLVMKAFLKTGLGGAITICWVLLLQGEQSGLDLAREALAWIGGVLVGGGILSADEFFRAHWYRHK